MIISVILIRVDYYKRELSLPLEMLVVFCINLQWKGIKLNQFVHYSPNFWKYFAGEVTGQVNTIELAHYGKSC